MVGRLSVSVLPAQVHKVDPDKTITLQVAGATAAYSMDSFLAEATAENGLVSIEGNQPGTTHVVVITSSEAQTFEVLVTTPPPIYPPGFVMPESGPESGQSGYYEGRYYSSPAQIQNQFDFLKIERRKLDPHARRGNQSCWDRSSRASPELRCPRRLMKSIPQTGTSRFWISTWTNPSSPSTDRLSGDSIWRKTTGLCTPATPAWRRLRGCSCPLQPELVVGGGYRYPLTANSSITGSFYYIRRSRFGSAGAVRNYRRPAIQIQPSGRLLVHRGLRASATASAPRDGSITKPTATLSWPWCGTCRWSLRLWALTICGVCIRTSPGRATSPRNSRLPLTFYNNNLVLPGLRETTISGFGEPALSAHPALGRYRRGARLQFPDQSAADARDSKFHPARRPRFSVEAFRSHWTIPVRR